MRILVFSDIHSNIYAIKPILKEKYDEAIFLGDIVDYGPRPSETIDAVREIAKYIIMGNHDYAAAFGKDCLCSQENHELSVYTRENITMKDLSENDLSFLRSLKDEIDLNIEGINFSLVHGSPSDHLYGYLYPWKMTNEYLRTPVGSYVDDGIILIGHTHYQFLLPFGNVILLNPGSSGQPRDIAEPSYSVIDTDKNTVEMKRFDYDRESLKKDIESRVSDPKYKGKLIELFRLV